MANVAVVGVQWGDEGKGKIVDWLAERADVVVRFQGGHNAGHTLVVDGSTYKLSLVPSGVVRGKFSLIGNGVVVDPWAFLQEIDRLAAQGIKVTPHLLRIADNACLILPMHREADVARESSNRGTRIGTTRRGIGPAYEDKVGRRAVRLIDLADDRALAERIETLLLHHNAMRRGLGFEEWQAEEIISALKEIAPRILPFADTVWRRLADLKREGKRIMFEGAQAAMLDVDHGTYPFVTSSNTLAGQAAAGSGVSASTISYVLGICKAYTTRVGEGPFPTEQDNEIGAKLGTLGKEFGTVTGRKRRCGWFDAVMVRQAITVGGVDGIALTKLDVLDEFDEIKICTGYKLGGAVVHHLPASSAAQARIEPIYETLEGWKANTRGARSWVDLPAQAIKYVRRVEELIGAPVAMLGTAPEREGLILVTDPFAD